MPRPVLDEAKGLRSRLRGSGRRLARAVLTDLADADREGFNEAARNAGMALEHLSKAYLVEVNPVLIADRLADFDTLLHLSGQGQHARGPLQAVRTVGAHEACLRVARLLPEFSYVEREGRKLFAARNGAAHLALSSAQGAREAARTMVRLLEPILVGLSWDRNIFWGTLTEAADTLLDESVHELQATVQMKFLAARERLAKRLEGVPEEHLAAVLAAVGGQKRWLSDYDTEEACPVCGATGWLGCSIEDSGEAQLQYEQIDDEDFRVYGWVDQVAVPAGFECSACGLSLEYQELEQAGLSTEAFDIEAREYEPGRDDPPDWL